MEFQMKPNGSFIYFNFKIHSSGCLQLNMYISSCGRHSQHRTMSLNAMSIGFLCTPDEPIAKADDIDQATRKILLRFHAEFNASKQRSTRGGAAVKDRENSDPSDGEESDYEENEYDAVDSTTGHVLRNGKWEPFLPLRWANKLLRDKSTLTSRVQKLIGEPIKSEHNALERPPVTNFHPIVPLHLIPKLNDGTAAGEYVRLVYRLKGKKHIGITTLELLSKGCLSNPEEQEKLKAFVTAEFEKIEKAGHNKSKLVNLMGLTVRHHDLMPVLESYEFKHYNFGKQLQFVDSNLEAEIAVYLCNFNKEDNEPVALPEGGKGKRKAELVIPSPQSSEDECSEPRKRRV